MLLLLLLLVMLLLVLLLKFVFGSLDACLIALHSTLIPQHRAGLHLPHAHLAHDPFPQTVNISTLRLPLVLCLVLLTLQRQQVQCVGGHCSSRGAWRVVQLLEPIVGEIVNCVDGGVWKVHPPAAAVAGGAAVAEHR